MATVFQDEQGQLVLDDPEARGVIAAVQKHNCGLTLAANADRVRHFENRVGQLGRSPDDVVIVVANVDTPAGWALADALMPGHDWQAYRNRGEVPFARGLAARQGIQEFVDAADAGAGQKLRQHAGLAVVVVDHQTVEIFAVPKESLP